MFIGTDPGAENMRTMTSTGVSTIGGAQKHREGPHRVISVGHMCRAYSSSLFTPYVHDWTATDS